MAASSSQGLPMVQPVGPQPSALPKLLAVAAGVVLCAVAMAVSFMAPSPTPGLIHAAGESAAATPTFMAPLPSLVWDAEDKDKERFNGWLTVPLNPVSTADDNPQLKLRIRTRPSPNQPAPRGTIVVHCGGPGSGKSCLESYISIPGGSIDLEMANLYNIIALDQRAIGDSDPKVNCGVTNATLPPVGTKPNTSAFFPDCPCNGLPDSTFRFLADEWADVLQTYEDFAGALQMCYEMPQLIQGPYNVMDFLGTAYLAHDLDLLRRSIGADKLSVYGISYGTMVGSVYASLYPENSDKIILDGNAPPAPNVDEWTRDATMNWQQIWAEFVDRCRVIEGCCKRDPQQAFQTLTELLETRQFGADTDFGKVSINPSLVIGQIHSQVRDHTHWGNSTGRIDEFVNYRAVGKFLDDWLDIAEADRANVTRDVLNSNCAVQVPVEQLETCKDKNGVSLAYNVESTPGFFMCPTWKQYGVCVSGPSSPASTQSTLMYTGVWSGDIPTQLLPSQMVNNVQRLKAGWGYFGVQGAHWLDLSTLWPGRASYPGIGTSRLAPLVMSQLDDSATGFQWTQQMKLAFPLSHLMTNHGLWHGFPIPFRKYPEEEDRKGLYPCFLQIRGYLKDGVLPRNGFVCHVTKYGVDEPQLKLNKFATHPDNFMPLA